jgi:hypothetical protein
MPKTLVLMLSSIFFLTSCATIFSKGSDTISLQTNPAGASVYLNNRKVCETPCEYKFKRSVLKQSHILVRLEGFEAERFALKKDFNPVALLNTTSITSWATDVLSGNMMEYNPLSYFIDLKRIGDESKLSLGQNEVLKYILVNYKNIVSDLAKGDGEFFKGLIKLGKKKRSDVLKYKNELLAAKDSYSFYSVFASI